MLVPLFSLFQKHAYINVSTVNTNHGEATWGCIIGRALPRRGLLGTVGINPPDDEQVVLSFGHCLELPVLSDNKKETNF